MEKIIAGSLNIDASDDWMKFMPNCFKCLRAAGDDLSVVEIIKLARKGIDKLNGKITLERQDKTRQDKTRQDAEIRLGCLTGFGGGNFAGQVFDDNGISPTLTDMQGDGRQPHIVETQRIICAMRGRNKENPSDIELEQRLEPQEDGICNTLTSVQKDNLVLEIKQGINPKYHDFIYEIDGEFYLIRIRKLMPIECWRLMNFTDHDFNKAQEVVSNSQLYKSAGNSIVVSVLMAIFSQLNISGVKPWNEMTDDERYNLIYKE